MPILHCIVYTQYYTSTIVHTLGFHRLFIRIYCQTTPSNIIGKKLQ